MIKCILFAQGSNLQSCSNDGTLELLGAASPLLGHILLKTLLVLPKNGNCRNDIVVPVWIIQKVEIRILFVSGIGGQMQTKADIWYYVPH